MSPESLTASGVVDAADAVEVRAGNMARWEGAESIGGGGPRRQPQPATDRAPARWPWAVRPTVIYLASRVVTLATLAVAATFTHHGILGEIDRWDSHWFVRAASTGWPTQLPQAHGHVAGSTIAFFPLFPLTIRGASALTGLSPLVSGIAVSTVTGLTATVAVWMLVRHYADQKSADRATLLVAMFPGSFVLGFVYSEGLAITLLAFGLLALMKGRWLSAGLLGMLATATTPIALAFEVSCAWCAYRSMADDRDWRALVAPVLTPIGFVTYQVWLWIHTGNAFAWRETERGGWNSFPSLAFPVHIIVTFVRDPIANTKTGDLLTVGIVLTAAAVAVRDRMPTPMLLYGLSAAGMGLFASPIGLRPRFVFLAFPPIVAVGTRLQGRAYLAVLSVSIALLAGVTAFSVFSWAVFP